MELQYVALTVYHYRILLRTSDGCS